MRTISTEKEIKAFLARLTKRAGSVSPEITASVQSILSHIQKRGDAALKDYTKRFDGHTRIALSKDDIARHASRADRKTVAALKLAATRIKRFHKHQLESSWTVKEPGITLGQLIRPLDRVGVYVPGGTAAYPSTVLMDIIPAQVAGVEEIAVAVPTPRGEINPYVMAAIEITGVTEIYTMGGAQAVGALAYGTKTIPKVDKIVGPGNVYVATAKRMVFGSVDIDMIAGPSEVLIIADHGAPAAFIAADLLSQAEHDPLASSVLITTSRRLAARVESEIEKQLLALGRAETARASLKAYGATIVVKGLDEAAAISNLIAPEHLEVMTKNPRALVKKLRHAGALFIGPWSPESLGDYAAGPNHTLPTGATARWASPLGVYDFLKRTSYIEFTQKGFHRLAGAVERIAEHEGLGAHARSVSIRRKR